MGNVKTTRYILSAGAPIVRLTPSNVLSAPSERQIPLFELLMNYGWTPNTPGYYGKVLLPSILSNLSLLGWFLAYDANLNLGAQDNNRDRNRKSDTKSCDALQTAAGRGDVEAVRMLLDAGAEIQNSVPLHYAAGACPPGTNLHYGRATPSKEFDESRIATMELLVERGADVNQRQETRNVVPQYAIVHAVTAGAVERVRWLLEHRADPHARGSYGSAVEYARTMGSEEMRRVLEEEVAVRRWVDDNVTGTELPQQVKPDLKLILSIAARGL